MRKQSIKVLLAALLSATGVVNGQTRMTLDQLYSLADEQSQSIRTFKTAVEAAQTGVAAAKVARLPDIGASLSIGYLGDGLLSDREMDNWQHIDNPHFMNNFALKAQQVIHHAALGKHRDALSPAVLPRLCLHHLEHSLHGVALRGDGLPPFLPGAERVQHDPHGDRRLRVHHPRLPAVRLPHPPPPLLHAALAHSGRDSEEIL